MSTTNIHDNGHFCAGNHSFDRTEFWLKVRVGAISCGCLFTAPGVSAACFFRERVSPLWETPLGVISQTRTEEVNVQVCARETFTSPTIGGEIRELSHSSQGVLKPFQFALKVQILQLVTIHMRLKLFRGINLGPAALTNRRVISRVIKMDG